MKIILASKSSRRSYLLKKLIKDFTIIDSKFDESLIKNKKPKEYCQKIAISKAQSVAQKNADSIVIAADTIVSIKNNILEKPSSYNEAFKMLKLLSGSTHFVHTGVSIIYPFNKSNVNFTETTKVKFVNLRDKDIKQYIDSNKPYDKAGSYGIQDPEFIFVDYIEGNYENVIGLPISKIYKILLELKVIK
tara:strand:+ start:732 stop:1301 length:570 start_codon:yes stop_codon:yes gene_type:complete